MIAYKKILEERTWPKYLTQDLVLKVSSKGFLGLGYFSEKLRNNVKPVTLI